MRLTSTLIAAVSTVQASDQWDKCEEIRKCNCDADSCLETAWEADCWMSTGSEGFFNGELSDKWNGNINYNIKNHPRLGFKQFQEKFPYSILLIPNRVSKIS